jgi:hypothetical protein
LSERGRKKTQASLFKVLQAANTMAATTSTGFAVHPIGRTQAIAVANTKRRRLVTPAAGHTLEIPGHAIE